MSCSMKSMGSGPPGRSPSFLPVECLQLHRKEKGRGARDTEPCPQTGHSRSAGHPLSASVTTPALYPTYSSFVLMAIELKETGSQGNEEKQRTRPQVACATCHCLTQSPELLSSVEAAHILQSRTPLCFSSKAYATSGFSKQLYQKQSLMSANKDRNFSLPLLNLKPIWKRNVFPWQMLTYFPFVLDPTQPLENTSNQKRRKCKTMNFRLCLPKNILLKPRAAPSAKVNICARTRFQV